MSHSIQDNGEHWQNQRETPPDETLRAATTFAMQTTCAQSIWTILFAFLILAGSSRLSLGQGTGGPIVPDSKVGYIDCAIPGDFFRLRYDSSYNNRAPSRAELFYAQGAPLGPGLPAPEPRVDYQDFSAYTELRLLPNLSASLDVPLRLLNPEVNANTGGLGDLNVGLKYALLTTETGTLSAQFRTYVPTGDADRGLGTNHVSLEPALLFYQSLNERAGIEGELRYWVPIGGTDFAGDIVRYGIGGHYQLLSTDEMWFGPVVEMVGWTVLDGKESVVDPLGLVQVSDAAGDTIMNSKVGMRLALDSQIDLYGGWGHALTGDQWYENTFRVEMRISF